MKNTTLCYIKCGGRTLMLHRTKKKNDENAGKWIGVGGHFEEGESPEECMLREVYEETGLVPASWEMRGIVTFLLEGLGTEYMFLFTAEVEAAPEEITCDEGELAWIDSDRLHLLPMWEGDAVFLGLIERGAPFFLLKLNYNSGGELVSASLDGRSIEI